MHATRDRVKISKNTLQIDEDGVGRLYYRVVSRVYQVQAEVHNLV